MPEATDVQMQAYCDQRIRVRAESLRLLLSQLSDDKASIDDEYARAVGTNRWNDNRADGPPHLLQSGNSANPDDVTNYNGLITALINLINGTSVANGSTVAADAATLHTNWATLQRACVRPAG